jgi:hypothetical protein
LNAGAVHGTSMPLSCWHGQYALEQHALVEKPFTPFSKPRFMRRKPYLERPTCNSRQTRRTVSLTEAQHGQAEEAEDETAP